MNHEQLALIGPILSRKVETSFPQVAVDGGIRFASNPILWVGDGDSGKVSTSIPMKMKPSQDETDLRFCLNQIQDWNWKQLHLFGFLGKRKDHEWANLGEVCQELKKRGEDSVAFFYDEESRVLIHFYPSGNHHFKLEGRFSLLSFEHNTITLSGKCKYTMSHEILSPLSGRGVSNEAQGEVSLQSSAPVMVLVDES